MLYLLKQKINKSKEKKMYIPFVIAVKIIGW